MTPHSYTIGDPVDALPPPLIPSGKSRDDWSHAYRAAHRARGHWVPVVFADRAQARNLAYIAKRRHGFESECRGATVFLRVKG